MAKNQNAFNKQENEKKRLKKRKEKLERTLGLPLHYYYCLVLL